jgi:DNA polymerase
MASRVSIDIETLSECDLKKTGTHVYARHPSTRVLCLAYAIDDAPGKVWRVANDEKMPDDLHAAILDPNVEFHAWNAGGFEMLVLPEALPEWPVIPIERWRCTMIRAAYCGLPMKLEQAAEALNASYKKDMVGHRLMLAMSKPRRDGSYWHETDASRYDRLCDYCIQDVEVERSIANQLPPLPASELELWREDFRMMSRGMPVDVEAIDALTRVAELSITKLNEQMRNVSLGHVSTVNTVGALLKYCHKRFAEVGITSDVADKLLPSTDKESVDAFLSELEDDGAFVRHKATGVSISKDVADMLRIRKEAAKSSVAKLQAMANCATSDATIHGLTMFYGASRTGRWAGRLCQIQNYPRGIKGVDPKIELEKIIAERAFYVPVGKSTRLEVVSSCLRGCFKPKEGKFYVGDFSQIEARVVAWLSSQQDVLDVFKSGQDVYTYTANKLGSKDRQFGKVLVLACGFGMGAAKFKDTAQTYNLTLTEEEAKEAVTLWREANPNIVSFWYDLERACKKVLKGEKQIERVGRVKVAMATNKLSGCLIIALPSGRHLVYRNARLAPGREGWKTDAIVYDGVNQITRKWEAVTSYGGKLVENVVQACARDLLAASLLNMEARHLRPLVTIHDEVICVGANKSISDDEFINELRGAMEMPPVWADGLPIAADVKAMERYGK